MCTPVHSPIERYLKNPDVNRWLFSTHAITTVTPQDLENCFVHTVELRSPKPQSVDEVPVEEMFIMTSISDTFILGVVCGLGQPHLLSQTPVMNGTRPIARRFAIDLSPRDAIELVEFNSFDDGKVIVCSRRFLQTQDCSFPCFANITLHEASNTYGILGPIKLRLNLNESPPCPSCGNYGISCPCHFGSTDTFDNPFQSSTSPFSPKNREIKSWSQLTSALRNKANLSVLRFTCFSFFENVGLVKVANHTFPILGLWHKGSTDYLNSLRRRAVSEMGINNVTPRVDSTISQAIVPRVEYSHTSKYSDVHASCCRLDEKGNDTNIENSFIDETEMINEAEINSSLNREEEIISRQILARKETRFEQSEITITSQSNPDIYATHQPQMVGNIEQQTPSPLSKKRPLPEPSSCPAVDEQQITFYDDDMFSFLPSILESPKFISHDSHAKSKSVSLSPTSEDQNRNMQSNAFLTTESGDGIALTLYPIASNEFSNHDSGYMQHISNIANNISNTMSTKRNQNRKQTLNFQKTENRETLRNTSSDNLIWSSSAPFPDRNKLSSPTLKATPTSTEPERYLQSAQRHATILKDIEQILTPSDPNTTQNSSIGPNDIAACVNLTNHELGAQQRAQSNVQNQHKNHVQLYASIGIDRKEDVNSSPPATCYKKQETNSTNYKNQLEYDTNNNNKNVTPSIGCFNPITRVHEEVTNIYYANPTTSNINLQYSTAITAVPTLTTQKREAENKKEVGGKLRTVTKRRASDEMIMLKVDAASSSANSPQEVPKNSSDSGRETNQKKHACKTCPSRFKVKGDLLRHVKVHHEGKKMHTCKFCNKKFGHSGHLNRHVQSVHLQQRRFKCDLCGFQFNQASHLQSHKSHIHNVHRKTFECKSCGAKHRSKTALRNHATNCSSSSTNHSRTKIKRPSTSSNDLASSPSSHHHHVFQRIQLL